jgi:hypothetical protein
MKFPKVKQGIWQWKAKDLTLTLDGKTYYGETSFQFKIFSQQNEFVTGQVLDNQGKFSGYEAIGVFKKNNKACDLYVVSNIPDLRTFIFTPSSCKKNVVDEFTGIVTDANTASPYNPFVGSIIMKWIKPII